MGGAWGHRASASDDLRVAGDRRRIGLEEVPFPGVERPVAVVPEVASLHPSQGFPRVAAFRPAPEHLPLSMPDFGERLLGRAVSVVVGPSPDDRVQIPYHLACGGLLVRS